MGLGPTGGRVSEVLGSLHALDDAHHTLLLSRKGQLLPNNPNEQRRRDHGGESSQDGNHTSWHRAGSDGTRVKKRVGNHRVGSLGKGRHTPLQ